MVERTQFQTASRARQLGNAIIWLRNQGTRQMGLTAVQSETIRYILKHHEEKPLVAADLMQALRLSQSTVAGILRRLEDKELICRTASPEDGRRSIISPTQKGLELETRLVQSAIETERILLRGMTQAEQTELNRLLQMALENIQSVRESGGNEDE